jgi:hypothetical protein
MDEETNKGYLAYLEAHPETLIDEPPKCSCGTMWMKGVMGGTLNSCQAQLAANAIKKRWEDYHKEKAAFLGFEFSLKDFVIQRNNLKK